ncbi:DUF5681 domain-containing protein [Frigidibacter oleivorans]|uniref:DUF5681 domain-containing protein n=1 Tax=Frigidibacter oleivorans TaxID=2487129 RepID=UPI00197A8D79|nr:DUF5681 domain-containing protein [Frigidibacter oleivorans]
MTDAAQPTWMQGFVPDTSPAPGRWRKGQSGNPAGRPKGSLSSRDKVARELRDDGPAVARKVIDAALAGDMQAASLVLSRLLPPLRSQTERVEFDFDPELPIGKQIEAVLAAVAAGQVPPDVGQMIINAISTLSSVRATEDLEARIIQLEAREVN